MRARYSTRPTRRIPLFVVMPLMAMAAVAAAACDGAEEEPDTLEDDTAGEVRVQDRTGVTDGAVVGEGLPDSVGVGTDTVRVELAAYTIDMPDRLGPGPATFRIRNTGTMEHGFEVERQGEEHVVESIPPGDSATLQVDLRPGTYEVYCPVGDHEERGMRMQLTVQEMR